MERRPQRPQRRRPDLDYTQPNAPMRPRRPRYPVPGSQEPTQPHYPVTMPPEPPRGRSHYTRYARRKEWVGCMRRTFEIGFALTLFFVMFSGLLTFMYIMAPPPRTNILILGLDSREGEGNVTRSDTMILATIDPDQPYVGMLSIPRDLYVRVPAYGENRINSAHVFGEDQVEGGGILLAQETVEQNFGIDMHRYVRVNFQGFVAIVDAAGGLDIDVPNHIIDYEYPTEDFGVRTIEFQPGMQHMDGETALIYARTRHGASDFERAERQQQVIGALMQRLASPENWWRVPAVYLAFNSHVETDLTLGDAIALAPAVIWVGPGKFEREVLTRDMARSETLDNGASVLLPDWDLIGQLTHRMFGQP